MPQQNLIVKPDVITNPTYRVRGQNNRIYPDPRLTPEHCETLQNINITEVGTARNKYGFSKYNSNQISSATDVRGLRQVTFKDGTTRQVVIAGATIKTVAAGSGTPTDITGAVTVSNTDGALIRSTFIDDKLFITDGTSESFYIDAAGDAEVLTGEQWSTCEDFQINNRVLCAIRTTESGTSFPTRIRWCDINARSFVLDVTNWPDDNRYEVDVDGAAIVGGIDNWQALNVFKEDGLHPVTLVYDTGFIEMRLATARPILGFEPIAKNSLVSRPEFLFCIARDGAYVIRPDYSIERITRDIQGDWESLNQGRLANAHSWIRQRDHQVRTLMSSETNTVGHDRILVYDWQNGNVWFDTLSVAQAFGGSWIISNVEYDMYGSTDGYVQQANDSTQTQEDGTDIDYTIKMAPNDLGFPNKSKEVVNLNTHYRSQTGSQTIQLTVELDQGRLLRKTENLSIGTTLQWDTGLKWDSGLTWPGGVNEIEQTFVNRTIQTIAPQWTGTDPFELVGYSVEFKLTE